MQRKILIVPDMGRKTVKRTGIVLAGREGGRYLRSHGAPFSMVLGVPTDAIRVRRSGGIGLFSLPNGTAPHTIGEEVFSGVERGR